MERVLLGAWRTRSFWTAEGLEYVGVMVVVRISVTIAAVSM